MNLHHESWWLEEVKEHYILFKKAASTVFCVAFSSAAIAMAVNTEGHVQGVSFNSIILFFSCIIPSLLLMWQLRSSFSKYHLFIAFFLIEAINIIFTIASYSNLQEHKVILAMNSTVMTLKYQIGFVKSLSFAFLVVLKQLFIWYFYRIIIGDIPFHVPCSIVLPTAFIIYAMFSEYLKRKKSYERYYTRYKLESTQRNLQTILDCFPDGLIVLNNKIEVKYSNIKILEYLHCSQENLLKVLDSLSSIRGREKKKLDNDNNITLLDDIKFQLLLETGKESSLGLTEHYKNSYEWKAKRILWEDEESILITCFDITKSVKYEKESTENKTKTSIIKSFSHELRTPISAIMYFAEKALKSKSISNDISIYIKYVTVASKQLFSQINDIIDLSNILSENFKIIKQTFKIREWAIENLEIFEAPAKEKNIEYEIRID